MREATYVSEARAREIATEAINEQVCLYVNGEGLARVCEASSERARPQEGETFVAHYSYGNLTPPASTVKAFAATRRQATEALHAKTRLEYLRGELRAERISYLELNELQGLADFIEEGDVELLEAAGVPEFPDGD